MQLKRSAIITSKLIISIVNRVTFLTPPFSNAFYWRRVEHLGTKSFSDLLLREVGSEQVCRIGQRSSLTNTLTKEIVHDGIRGKTLNLPSSTKRGSFSRIRRAGADPRQGRTHTLYLPNNLEIKPRLVAQRSSMHFNRWKFSFFEIEHEQKSFPTNYSFWVHLKDKLIFCFEWKRNIKI